MRTLVIGIGNLLRTDDGVGIHVVNKLNRIDPKIPTLDAAMGSIELLEAMIGYEQVIIVDAIQTGAEPGKIYKVNLTGGDKPPVITHTHGVDLITTLQLGKELYGNEMPKILILIAIEAEDSMTLGMEPTENVGRAIEEVVEEIINLLPKSG